MDEIAAGAITAVWHRDLDQARRWFQAICDVYRTLVESGVHDWSDFTRMLAERATRDSIAAGAVDGFVSFVEKYSATPLDVVAQLADPLRQDELLPRYVRAIEHGQ